MSKRTRKRAAAPDPSDVGFLTGAAAEAIVPPVMAEHITRQFEMLRVALQEAIAAGAMGDVTPEHLAALTPLLKDHPAVAEALFRSGFLSAVTTVMIPAASAVQADDSPWAQGPHSRPVGRA